MKLRIFQNSIRLRLSKSEVNQLADNQTIEMRADFFPQPLVYQLAVAREKEPVSATFNQGILRVAVPFLQLRNWATSDQVGIEMTLPGASGREPLNVLIEKDFKCLHGEAEDQDDCFANPLAIE